VPVPRQERGRPGRRYSALIDRPNRARSSGAIHAGPLLQGDSSVPWWLTRPGRVALGALLLFAFAYTLQIARPLLLPLVLSCLLAVVLAPVVRLLRKLHLPSPLAAAIVVGAFTGATAYGVYALADPAANWIERAPGTMREIEHRLSTVKASVIEARAAADTVENIARVDGDSPPTEVTVKEPSLAARLVATTQAALLHAVEVIILLYFLLAFGETFLRKLVKLPDRMRAKIRVVEVITTIEGEISNYLLTISCINAGLGLATGIAMAVLGMPNPVLWGVMAAVLNFVPYLGSAVTLVVLTLVAILTFDTLPRALLAPAVFLALATLEGQFITPIIVGRRMSLSPPIIAIALLVGAWIWGIVGLLIAVPVLAMVKIYCAHDEDLSSVEAILSGD
jgi:predicted PurR-regulated permease PerM